MSHSVYFFPVRQYYIWDLSMLLIYKSSYWFLTHAQYSVIFCNILHHIFCRILHQYLQYSAPYFTYLLPSDRHLECFYLCFAVTNNTAKNIIFPFRTVEEFLWGECPRIDLLCYCVEDYLNRLSSTYHSQVYPPTTSAWERNCFTIFTLSLDMIQFYPTF